MLLARKPVTLMFYVLIVTNVSSFRAKNVCGMTAHLYTGERLQLRIYRQNRQLSFFH